MITLRVRYCYVQSLTSLISPEITRHDHYYCLFAPHIRMVLFLTHIPFVVNYTFKATPPESLQQHPLLFTTNHTDRTFFV